MDTVWRGVDAMRAVRHRNVTGIFGTMASIDNRNAVDFLEITLGNGLFDTLQIEDDDQSCSLDIISARVVPSSEL